MAMNSQELMNYANELASFSKDPSTKIGALLVRDEMIIGRGWNRLAKGFEDTDLNWSRPRKYDIVVHAEQSSIYDAAFRGNSTEGSEMYSNYAACTNCAKAIVSSGISVLYRNEPMDNPRWMEEVEKGDKILAQGGVSIVTMPLKGEQSNE
tara:strand:- start:234 stop:686 length:453 start_codon:yes stop_codon:yes gene_type:complete